MNTFFGRFGVTCSAGRSLPAQAGPRSPAAFSLFPVTYSASRSPRPRSGHQPHSPPAFPRKKLQPSRSTQGGANAV